MSPGARGSVLLEQVLSLGLVAMLLLMIAATTVQTSRASKSSRLRYEARNAARSLVEQYQARSVSLLVVGNEPPVNGQFSNGHPYTANVRLSSCGGSGSFAGLSDQEVKRIDVTVTWRDNQGNQQELLSAILVKVAR